MSKRWKHTELDYSALLTYEDDTDLTVCLTQRQIAILKALLIPAYWLTRWTDIAISSDTLEAQIAEIDYRLDNDGCGLMIDYRDNPLDLCEVQYSKDGGETWLTMFRKDTCPPPAQGLDIDQSYTDITTVNNNNTTWDNDITNIAPQWGYVDEFSDRALCWAISMYVDWVCDFAISQIKSGNVVRRDANDWLDDIQEFITAATIAAIASTFGLATLPSAAVGAVAWAVVEVIDALWDDLVSVDYSIFEDEETRQIIKCMMYQAQAGVTPQYPGWRDSLEYFTSLGVDEQKVARSVHVMNSSVNVYINWMLLMQDINSISDTLPECPCPDRWTHTWNFETHGVDTWEATGEWGHYSEGEGFVTDDRLLTGWWSRMVLDIDFPEAVPRCDAITIHYYAEKGLFEDTVPGFYFFNPPLGGHTDNHGYITDGENVRKWSFALTFLDSVTVGLRVCHNEIVADGVGTVVAVTLEGVGVDPFFGRETS